MSCCEGNAQHRARYSVYSINVSHAVAIHESTRYHLLTASSCLTLATTLRPGEEDEAEEDRNLWRRSPWPEALDPANGPSSWIRLKALRTS